jgi:hypothetical protein
MVVFNCFIGIFIFALTGFSLGGIVGAVLHSAPTTNSGKPLRGGLPN